MKRVVGLLGAAAFALTFAGCQGGGTPGGGSNAVVATVNGENISEKQFFDRVQNTTAYNLGPAIEQPQGAPGRAGEYAMQTLLTDSIIFQAAKAKNLIPSDEQINKYVAFAKKYQANPPATMVNPDPFRDDSMWLEDVKRVMTYRALILSHTKMPEEELRKEYQQNLKFLKEPNSFHLRLVDTRSEAKAREALTALQKGVAFETVALKHSEDPVSGPKSGDVGTVPEDYLQRMAPGILDAAKKTKPGEYHKGIVKQEIAEGAAPGQPGSRKVTHYYLVQVVEKNEGKTPSFEDSRYLLENARLGQKEQTAVVKARDEIRLLTEKADMKVNLARYKDMPDRIKRSVQSMPPPGTATPAPSGAAPLPAEDHSGHAHPPAGAPARP